MKAISVNEEQFKVDAKMLSLKELAEKYGVKKCTISVWKKKFDVLTVPKNISLPEKEVFAKEVEKYTNVQLAEKYGVGLRLISKWRVRLGLANVWTKQIIDWERFDKDAKVLKNGELVDKYNSSLSTVKLWKQKRGLTTGKKENKKVRFRVTKHTGCWICTSHKLNNKGYPQCKDERIVVKRLWVEKNGVWPVGMSCCHTCDNAACVNPDHVYPGTQKENQEEMAERDRSPWGWRNGVRKLSPEKAKEIYLLKGKETEQVVADKYGVCKSTINAIWSGRTWVRDVAGVRNFPVKLTSVSDGLSGLVQR